MSHCIERMAFTTDRYVLWCMHLHLRLIGHMVVIFISHSGAVPLAAVAEGDPVCILLCAMLQAMQS